MAIKERDYILCAGHTEDGKPCPFFIDVNSDHEDDPDNIAPWVHLTRGDAADDALDDHEAVPGEAHFLDWWRVWGPERVRARFLIEADPEAIAAHILAAHAIQPHWSRSGEQVQLLITEAVRLDRLARR